jgi:hypothetical protein
VEPIRTGEPTVIPASRNAPIDRRGEKVRHPELDVLSSDQPQFKRDADDSSLATLAVILDGAGVLLATTGICGAAGITAAVYERKSPEVTDRWFQIGTAVGFTVGIPLTIVSFILLQRSL